MENSPEDVQGKFCHMHTLLHTPISRNNLLFGVPSLSFQRVRDANRYTSGGSLQTMDFEEEVGNVVGDRPIFKPPSVVDTSTTERGDGDLGAASEDDSGERGEREEEDDNRTKRRKTSGGGRELMRAVQQLLDVKKTELEERKKDREQLAMVLELLRRAGSGSSE